MSKKDIRLYGTLGPSCCEEDLLYQMFAAGMTGVRLNLSHRSLAECRDWLDALYRAADRFHIIPDLLVDLQGPELRIGDLSRPLYCRQGQVFMLILDQGLICDDRIPLSPVIFDRLEKGMKLKFNDGKVVMEVLDVRSQTAIAAKVLREGEISSKKSIACDRLHLSLPVLTSQDRESIKQLGKYHVTGVMQPFVTGKNQLIALRQELLKEGAGHVRIFAKIESLEGANSVADLFPYCDEIVIARGDLGNAVPLPTLPALQKRISRACLHFKKPFMVVTQMLASMEHSPTPTRAELTDIFQAVLDGASSLMLTGETAAGDYPLEAMRVLSDTAWEARRFLMESRFDF